MLSIIKKTGCMVLMLLFLSGLTFTSVSAATKPGKIECKVTKIKVNKKTVKPGDKLTIRVNIKTNTKFKKLKVDYIGPFYYDSSKENISEADERKIINMKAINKSRTKWKATIRITKNMINGTWGISGIYAIKKNFTNYIIENNRWRLDSGRKVKRQNLSAGNIKVKAE